MEFWDIYDKDKKPTGRTMKRNDWCLKDGEYHLTVLGVVARPDGTFLITKRVMTKAWAPGCWEVSGGAAQAGEESREAVLREVKEETGVSASIIKYIGKSSYSFNTPQDMVEKDVHWYLMMADSYYSKPQREEHFVDSGYYKFYEAYHLLKFSNEKQILEKAYNEYRDLKKANLWGSKKYF